MSEQCAGQCGSCSADCADRQPADFHEPPHRFSSIKRLIGVVSGKGGVGKSLVTGMLAVTAQRNGWRAAILDADITGPSIPRAFGLKEKALSNGDGILPVQSRTGIQIISTNLMLKNETDPVVWRGPIIANMVRQFWTDVIWDDVDYMFIDMPPGTGDVPLTIFQTLPLDGIVIVTSPQQLVGMIVEKAVNMAGLMNIPVLALVENMSYFTCPDCKSTHSIFGESRGEELAKKHGIPTLCRLPINPKLAAATDAGTLELFHQPEIEAVMKALPGIERAE